MNERQLGGSHQLYSTNQKFGPEAVSLTPPPYLLPSGRMEAAGMSGWVLDAPLELMMVERFWL